MKFHDKDYDGIVLRLPSWFIELNNLEPAVEQLHNALKECNLSTYHPDHTHNIYELENFRKKKQMITAQNDDIRKKKEQKDNELKRLYAGEEFNLEWVNIKCIFDNGFSTRIILPDKSEYNSQDIFTKIGIKASFEKIFRDQIKTLEDLRNLTHKNLNIKLQQLLKDCQEFDIDMNYKLFNSTQGWDILGISINRLCVCHDVKETKDGYKYKYITSELIKYEDGVLGYRTGNRPIRLEGFKRKGLKLVKDVSNN